MEFRVLGSGCRVQGAGCRVQGAGFRVQGAGCRVQGSGCRVQGGAVIFATFATLKGWGSGFTGVPRSSTTDPPPRTTIESYVQSYCNVLGGGVFLMSEVLVLGRRGVLMNEIPL